MDSADTAQAFEAPSLALLATEPLRAALDFLSAHIGATPRRVGDGHPVVVYPGLGGGAVTTAHLRRFLNECGFVALDWELGVNRGPEGLFEAWSRKLADPVRELHARRGHKVSLVGWSLGGIYAREVAKCFPDAVRQVITLGTPFSALGDGNHAGTIFRLLGGDTSQLTPALQARLREPPPVPTTSVYSRSDGVVCWRGCLEQEGPGRENIEVNASHLGMGTHPEVLRIVADRLAQPEGRWRPYRPGRVRRSLKAATRPSRSRT